MDSSAVYSEDHKRVSTKFLGVVFLYMFMGLAISALTAFLFALFITKTFYDPNTLSLISEQGQTVLLFSVIGAMVVALIDSFVMPIVSSRTGKAPWVGYILYALCMGVSLSVVLLAGVSFGTIGEAFGLTALVFLVMALIGIFSKVNLTPLAFIGISLMIGIFILAAFWGIVYWVNPGMFVNGYGLYYMLVSIGIIIVMMLFVAYDVNRMVAIADQGMATTNTALYCAFTLYGDFIVLFLRILMVLLATRRN
jgi:FtsH-binding integral membrane protein